MEIKADNRFQVEGNLFLLAMAFLRLINSLNIFLGSIFLLSGEKI